MVDVTGNIFYLNPGDGQANFTINSPVYPGGGGISLTNSVSASSLAVSTASNMVFVAGWGNVGDEVCAYDATNATNKWCQAFTGNQQAQRTTSVPLRGERLAGVGVCNRPAAVLKWFRTRPTFTPSS